MLRSPAISGKATATKLSKEKWLSRVQSVREKGENGIGGSSTVTSLAKSRKSVVTKSLKKKWEKREQSAKVNREKEIGRSSTIAHLMVDQEYTRGFVPLPESSWQGLI